MRSRQRGYGLKQVHTFVRATIQGGDVVIPWQRITENVDDRSLEQVFFDHMLKGCRADMDRYERIHIIESKFPEILPLPPGEPNALHFHISSNDLKIREVDPFELAAGGDE